MSIQYAGGTISNTAFTSSSRTDLADQMKTILVGTVGWTVVSGSSGDWILKSAVDGSGRAIRVRLHDPGAGNNCIRITVFDQDGNGSSTEYFNLLPDNSNAMRFIANKYQFWAFYQGTLRNVGRRMFACGLLYTFPFVSPTTNIWAQGTGRTDTDTSSYPCFTSDLSISSGSNTNHCPQYNNYNGNAYTNNGGITAPGAQRLIYPTSQHEAQGAAVFNGQFQDDSYLVSEPLLAAGLTSATAANAKINGQLWDSFITREPAKTGDTTFTFDSRTYYVLTEQVTFGGAAGTLCVAVT